MMWVRSCVQEDITKALRAVHARFFLSATTLNMALVGPGLVGGALLDQMQSQCCSLQEQYKLDVRVLAIATSTKVLFSQLGMLVHHHQQLGPRRDHSLVPKVHCA
jgi:bifunctional aspartokinase / homoserine dehydrogenase 1